jgi:hypothetical protein
MKKLPAIICFLLSFTLSAQDKVYEIEDPTHFKLFLMNDAVQKMYYTAKIVKNYMDIKHPNAESMEWFRDTTAHTYFKYKVIFEENKEDKTLIINFESYSDGLEWHFWIGELARKNKFQIITDKSSQEKIKTYLKTNNISTQKMDVFRYTELEFTTPQKTDIDVFPDGTKKESYGVFVEENEPFYFDRKGEKSAP